MHSCYDFCVGWQRLLRTPHKFNQILLVNVVCIEREVTISHLVNSPEDIGFLTCITGLNSEDCFHDQHNLHIQPNNFFCLSSLFLLFLFHGSMKLNVKVFFVQILNLFQKLFKGAFAPSFECLKFICFFNLLKHEVFSAVIKVLRSQLSLIIIIGNPNDISERI